MATVTISPITGKRYCKHGNDLSSYICPECDYEKTRKRQTAIDRIRLKNQLARIRGTRTI
jgi:hypothetical protein